MADTDAVTESEWFVGMSWECPIPGCDWTWPHGPIDIKPTQTQRALLTNAQIRLMAQAHELSAFAKAVNDHFCEGRELDHNPMALVGEVLRLRTLVLDTIGVCLGPEDDIPEPRQLAADLQRRLEPPINERERPGHELAEDPFASSEPPF